uniref:Uncharacterized protein n=1 Tax=Gasterosteus aculeatus aculeatus TaxID=481459 RepID=G3PJW9_GASAC
MGVSEHGRSSTAFKPSALPASYYSAFASPDSPVALPSISEPNLVVRDADITHFAFENSFPRSEVPAEEPHPLATPSLSPSEPISESSPQFEAATFFTDWKLAKAKSSTQSFPLSPTPLRSKLKPQANISMAPLSPTTFTTPTSPQFDPKSDQKPISLQQGGASEQTAAIVTSFPAQPLEQPELPFADFAADDPHSRILEVNRTAPSGAPVKDNQPTRDTNMLPNPDMILAPGYNVPFIDPHPTLLSSEPTEVPPEDFYPTNSMEVDWGSGDYLETMSFLNADGEDYPLATRVPSDSYDPEDYTESYDTSFPPRVGIPLRLCNLSIAIFPLKSIDPSSLTSAIHYTLDPTPRANSEVPDASDINLPDSFTIQPTDVLLPDMNSMEYYVTQLTMEKDGSDPEAERSRNVTMVSVGAADIAPSGSVTEDTNLAEDGSSSDLSGFEPKDESSTTEESPQLINATHSFLDPSIVSSHFFDPSASVWGGQVPTTEWSVGLLPSATPLLPDDVLLSTSLTDVHWFVTESFPSSTTPVLTATVGPPDTPTELPANTTAGTAELTPQESTEQTFNITSVSTEPTSNSTLDPPVVLATTRATGTTEASTSVNVTTATSERNMTTTTATTAAPRPYLCHPERPAYLINISFPSGATVGYAKSQVRDILKGEFNKSMELQVVDPPPKFVFRVVSGPVVYTAISVVNALRKSGRRFLFLSPNWTTPDRKYQVHTVLQFVPGHVDVRFCNFSESVETGLTMAFAEVRRRSKETTNFTVQLNVLFHQLVRQPVDLIFTVRGSRGYLMGSEVSNALMKLTMVEFSYYMGFPVLQIAEPFHYPELNTSQLLRSSWVRTVLLGVLDQTVGERTFQANMERRVAMLLGEATGLIRRVRRATLIGNNSIQVVSASRLVGEDRPLEMVYFVEAPGGQRLPAAQTANLLNSLDVQRAAIVLGYRVQGILAQPVEKVAPSPSDAESTNAWIVVGVVIPVLVVVVILSILYWKLCRTDKLEFQPDAMTSIQQRQKLQAPSVKGFDFAKLHLGQHSKDDVMVIQEPVPSGPGPLSLKDGLSPSENGEIPTPVSKTSTKASRSGRRRERISPSDGDSVVSDRSSERESAEENPRGQATPSDSKHNRKVPINVLNGPPPLNCKNEPLSSAFIFEHVDRMARATDASRRLPNKIQLIAMQPMPVPPLHSPPISGKLSDTNQINKEIQVALRHKSEIEHHRNKIRLRAKRKGHYDFPAMEDTTSGLGDAKDQDRIYQKAQIQIDKILDPDSQMPPFFLESKKSSRGRRSPKHRMKEQLNGGLIEADKDHLITDDSDAVYRKCPGVNNVAYISDPDQGPGSPHRSPSPTDDVFLGPASSPPGHAPPPPPYMTPQPSIEEARQQMHSLLDDAFALVSPTSQGSTAGITLPGVNTNPPLCSPPGRGPRAWGPSYQAPGRFTDLSMSPSPVQGLTPRQSRGSCYLPAGETAGQCEQPQPDSLYSSRGLYADELPSSARPRPVGGTTGAHRHTHTYIDVNKAQGGHMPDSFIPEKDFLECPDYTSSSAFQAPRGGIREPSAPPVHLDSPVVGYLSAPPPLDTSPPNHSSASLIKAIREELLRLSQKQAAVPSYHS